jgi:hypothetical protein
MINNPNSTPTVKRSKKLYDRLYSAGTVKGLPDSFDVFESAMADSAKRRAFYDRLADNGAVKGLPDFERFSGLFGDGGGENVGDRSLGDRSLEVQNSGAPSPLSPPAEGKDGDMSIAGKFSKGLDALKAAGGESNQGRVMEAANRFSEGFVRPLSVDILRSFAVGGTKVSNALGLTDEMAVENSPVYRFAEDLSKDIDVLFPQNKKYQDEFLARKFPEGLGSAASFGVGGVASKAVKVPAIASSTIFGSSTIAANEFVNAKDAGASDDEAFNAFLLNLPLGATEAIPLGKMMRRLDKVSGGKFTGILSRKLTNKYAKMGAEALAGGVEEAFQETILQQLPSNIVAGQTYDETKSLYEGLVEGGTTGFAVGLTLNALGLGVANMRANSDLQLSPEQEAELQKIQDFLDEKGEELRIKNEELRIQNAKRGYIEGEVVPEIGFSFDPEADVETQKAQLNAEFSRLMGIKDQFLDNESVVKDIDLALDDITRIESELGRAENVGVENKGVQNSTANIEQPTANEQVEEGERISNIEQGIRNDEGAEIPVSEDGDYQIYTQVINGKEQFLVPNRSRKTGQGFGDSIHDTLEDAIEEVKLNRQRDARQSNSSPTNESEPLVDLSGFEETLDPKNKQRVINVLSKNVERDGSLITRKELIESKVQDGWVISEFKNKPVLEDPETNSFLDTSDLTKTGIDYAEYLIDKNASSEKGSDKVEEGSGSESGTVAPETKGVWDDQKLLNTYKKKYSIEPTAGALDFLKKRTKVVDSDINIENVFRVASNIAKEYPSNKPLPISVFAEAIEYEVMSNKLGLSDWYVKNQLDGKPTSQADRMKELGALDDFDRNFYEKTNELVSKINTSLSKKENPDVLKKVVGYEYDELYKQYAPTLEKSTKKKVGFASLRALEEVYNNLEDQGNKASKSTARKGIEYNFPDVIKVKKPTFVSKSNGFLLKFSNGLEVSATKYKDGSFDLIVGKETTDAGGIEGFNQLSDTIVAKDKRELNSKLTNIYEKYLKSTKSEEVNQKTIPEFLAPYSKSIDKIPLVKDKIDLDITDEIEFTPPLTSKIPALKKWEKDNPISIVVSKDDLRPALQGVYYDADEGVKVATDGYKMVVTPDSRIKKSKVVNPKTGDMINEKFPNWKAVVPDSDTYIFTADLSNDVIEQIYANERFNRFFKNYKQKDNLFHKITTEPGMEVYLAAENLGRAVRSLKELGSKNLEIRLDAPKKGVIILDKDDNRRFAVVMPASKPNASIYTPLLTNVKMNGASIDSKISQLENFENDWSWNFDKKNLTDAQEKNDEWNIKYYSDKLKNREAEINKEIEELKNFRDNNVPVKKQASPKRSGFADGTTEGFGGEFEGGSNPLNVDRKLAEAKQIEVVDEYGRQREVTLGELENITGLELPELVTFTRELTGSAPSISTRFTSTRGVFYPVGDGKIALKASIFKDTKLASQVLAHEIGHLIDYLPEQTMSRGNILGRLLTLRKYLKTTAEGSASRGEALSTKDRAKLRRMAEKAVIDESGITLQEYINDKDLKASLSDGIKERYQEYVKREIENRGLLDNKALFDELYAHSKAWRPFEEAEVSADFLMYRRSSAELYADALSALLVSPGTLQKNAPTFYAEFFEQLDNKPEVKTQFAELQALLTGGRERLLRLRNETINQSFYSSEDLNLALIEERENAKQDFVDSFKQSIVNKYHPIIKKVNEAKLAGKTIRAAEDPTYLLEELDYKDNVTSAYLYDVGEQVAKPIEDAGMTTLELHKFLLFNRIANEGKSAELQSDRVQSDEVTDFLRESDEALDAEKKKYGRAYMANPGGLTSEASQELLDNMHMELGSEQFELLEQSARRFQELNFEFVEQAVEEGVYSRELFEKIIEPNKYNYATFRVLDYIQYPDYVTSAIQESSGTLKDVGSTFDATLLKTVALIQTNAINRAKRGVRDTWANHFSDEISKAKYLGDGKFAKEPGLEHLFVLENGQRVAYNIDPYIAKVFDYTNPKMLNWFVKLVRASNESVYRPLFITYNPGFIFWSNPKRDSGRLYRNLILPVEKTGNKMADYSSVIKRELKHPVRIMKGYIDNWQTAKAYSKGEISNPKIRKLIDDFAITPPGEGLVFKDRGDALGRQMERFHLIDGQKNWVQKQLEKNKAVQWMPKLLANIRQKGSMLEILPKLVASDILEAEGVSKEQRSYRIRNHFGTPNFKAGGADKNFTNSIYMFSNIMVQGYKADIEVATNPKTRGAWWFRMIMTSMLPKLLVRGALLGWMGKELQEFYDRVTEYDKTNYTVIPLGWKGEGTNKEAVYLRVPQDESARLMSSVIWKLTGVLAEDNRSDWNGVFDLGADELPGPAPALVTLSKWGQYLSGSNPKDDWRDRPILPTRMHKARKENPVPALKKMVQWSVNQTGVTSLVTYNEHAESWDEVILQTTPILNRMIKSTNYGLKEKQSEEQNLEDAKTNARRLEYGDDVLRMISSTYYLRKLGDARTTDQEIEYEYYNNFYQQVYRPYDELIQQYMEMGDDEAAKDAISSMKEFADEYKTMIEEAN